jgi:hypothetical protein
LLGLAAVAVGLTAFAGTAAAANKKVPVSSEKLDAPALARLIDQHVQQRLDAEKVKPSPLADDAEFIRRVYLDITGMIPPADKVAAFLDSKDTVKRTQLIDELLADPTYGRHQADIWQSMLLPRTSDNRRLTTQPLIDWLNKEFNDNTPWNKLVENLLTATGPQDKNGAVTFFLANPTADKMTDTVTRLFLGVQLQCAQCHNHPFTGWKQDEYWQMAAFFLKVRADNVNMAARNGTTPGINESNTGRQRLLPESAKFLAPKYLQGEQPKVDSKEPYRPVLTKWLATADNPFFSRAMANRTWAQLFGRGFVNPIDDMHDGNAPSHPQLLAELANQFAVNGFDVKYLIRAICNSQTYQRSSKPYAGNEDSTHLFSHMAVKVLTGEQLYDSLEVVLGKERGPAARPAAAQRANANNPRTQFVNFFLSDEGADPTEYQSGIPQALRLMNSGRMNGTAEILTKAVKSDRTPAQVIEHLYLGTLARRPTAVESERLTKYVQENGGTKAYNDILWALLNSSEFALNH